MLRFLKTHFATGVKIILFLIGISILYIVSKLVLSDTLFFKNILIAYAASIATVLQWFDNFQFDAITGNISFNGNITRSLSGLAFKFIPLAFVILFFIPRKIGKTILIFLAATLAFYLISVLRFLNDFFTPSILSGFFFSIIVSLRFLTLYFILKYKIGLHQSLTNYFNKIDVKVVETFHFSFHKLLMVVAMVPAITGFFDWFLISDWNVFVDGLSYLILWLSNAMLWLLGFSEAYVFGKYILLNNYWLYLGTNCLGVGLMVVFSSLIFAIRSPLANKLIFVTVGLVILLLMNALRIVVILLYIYLNQIPQQLIDDYHNLSNNVFYIVVFGIILFYINKFQFVKLRIDKK